MQAFCWDVVRALTKLGIAMAANRPMMATTIMISTRVNPALRDVLFVFIFLIFVCAVELSVRRVIIMIIWFRYCLTQPRWFNQKQRKSQTQEMDVWLVLIVL